MTVGGKKKNEKFVVIGSLMFSCGVLRSNKRGSSSVAECCHGVLGGQTWGTTSYYMYCPRATAFTVWPCVRSIVANMDLNQHHNKYQSTWHLPMPDCAVQWQQTACQCIEVSGGWYGKTNHVLYCKGRDKVWIHWTKLLVVICQKKSYFSVPNRHYDK